MDQRVSWPHAQFVLPGDKGTSANPRWKPFVGTFGQELRPVQGISYDNLNQVTCEPYDRTAHPFGNEFFALPLREGDGYFLWERVRNYANARRFWFANPAAGVPVTPLEFDGHESNGLSPLEVTYLPFVDGYLLPLMATAASPPPRKTWSVRVLYKTGKVEAFSLVPPLLSWVNDNKIGVAIPLLTGIGPLWLFRGPEKYFPRFGAYVARGAQLARVLEGELFTITSAASASGCRIAYIQNSTPYFAAYREIPPERRPPPTIRITDLCGEISK